MSVGAQEPSAKKTPRVIDGPAHFYKTEAYVEMNNADRELYTSGLMDGFFASGMFGAGDEIVATLRSCTKDMDSRQLTAIITKYVKDHPETWHYPLSIEAFNALAGVCKLKPVN